MGSTMITVEPVPHPTQGFAREMMEAVAAACQLPEGEIRNELIVELTMFMKIMSKRMCVAVENYEAAAANIRATGDSWRAR